MSSSVLKREHVQWKHEDVSTWTPYHENGQTYNVFASGFANVVEMFSELQKRHKDKVLLVDESGKKLTFQELFGAADVLSRSLADKACSGLSRGDRVGICSRNSFEWVVAYVATCFAGMVVIPMNSWWTPKEVEYAVKKADIKVLFADVERIERLRQIPISTMSGVKVVLITDGTSVLPTVAKPVDPFGMVVDSFDRWMTIGRGRLSVLSSESTVSPDKPAMIMFTSGTTNFPKGVVLTHRGICHSCNMSDNVFALNETKLAAKEGGAHAVLLCVPLFHATGLYAVLFNAMLAGRKVVLMRKWNAEKALELIEREKVTHFTGVPTMVLEMLASPDLKTRNISSLKNIGSGGAPPPAGVAKKVKDKLKAAPSQGFGLTEVNAFATMIGAKDYLKKPTSCGRPVPGVEIKIWHEDKDGIELRVGEVGRIVIRGPNLMLEYYKDYDATSKAITADGWFKCGDYGHIDKDGFLFISGRSQDLLIRGGENISARTVEEAVFASFESIQECAVFGYPHATLGEEVGLAVYMKEGENPPTLEQIRDKCASQIAPFMLPTGLTVFKRKKLPRGATGKTVKKDIKDMLKNGKLENWTVYTKAKL